MLAVSIRIATGSLSAASLVAPVNAQENEAPKDSTKGVYVTAGVGGSWSSGNATTTTSNPTFEIDGVRYPSTGSMLGNAPLGGGVAVEAGVGYDFGNNFRSELTYLYNAASLGTSSYSTSNLRVDGDSYNGTATASTSGNVKTNSVMVSGYYDIQTNSKFTPYVGAGIGYTSVSIPAQNRVAANFNVDGFQGAGWLDFPGGSASAFGYQAKIGVSYAVSKPADLYLEGTYQGNTGVTISGTEFSALNLFGVRAGFRYRFGS